VEKSLFERSVQIQRIVAGLPVKTDHKKPHLRQPFRAEWKNLCLNAVCKFKGWPNQRNIPPILSTCQAHIAKKFNSVVI
jgi:hypothetical protein